jgi:hypothetical protein
MAVVLVAAQEAGSANALVPVIRRLQGRGGVHVSAVACAQAVSVFEREGIAHRFVAITGSAQDGADNLACQLLKEHHPDVLLLGTSWGPSVEKALLRVARIEGLPSLSVVDMWCHYRERFTDPSSGALCLPTKVAVIDAGAFDRAVAAGIPSDALVMTGQPYLDSLRDRFRDPDLARQASVLRRVWIGGSNEADSRRVVVFASEPLSVDFGPGTPHDRGYTELEALEALVEATEQCEQALRLEATIVIKLHPRQARQSVGLGPLALRRDIRVVADQPSWPCILAADVIVGMESIFLIESALAGKPTIRVHLNRQKPDVLAGSPIERLPTASSSQELARLLIGSLTEPSAMTTAGWGNCHDGWARLADGDAASRVAALTLELAGAARNPAVGTSR